jgi:hypothetical protein
MGRKVPYYLELSSDLRNKVRFLGGPAAVIGDVAYVGVLPRSLGLSREGLYAALDPKSQKTCQNPGRKK